MKALKDFILEYEISHDGKGNYREEVELDELSDTTLMNYSQKVHDDSLKHDKDPSKRSATKRNKSVMGFSRALNKLESRPVKEDLDEAVTVKKANYSWGKMMTVHHGSDTSYPLHPEHQAAIKKLRSGDKTSFKDETGRTVHAHREGDQVHLVHHNIGSSTAKKTTVGYHHFDEAVEIQEDQTTSEYKVKKTVGADGKTHSRKVRPHKVHFKNSGNNAEPETEDSIDDKENMKKEELELISFTAFTASLALDEKFINGREYASHGLMHPDHAKMHKVGDSRDFYAHGSGDKLSGKVTKNDGKEVHVQADKMSGGKVHKFKVTPHLPAQNNEEVDEELKGGQVKLDKNKNGKLDADDFKKLRKEEAEQIQERLKVTHEDPLVTVHDKDGLHTHANLSVANHIFQTKVKHTDVHKGPVKVKSGGSYGNVTFAISQHHAKDVVKEETDLDEAVKTGNEGNGYHGQQSSEKADAAYSKAHATVKKVAGEAGHLRDAKKPNVMVKHYLDSVHGRHLAGREGDHEYIKKDFGKFKKSYKPEMHEEVELDEKAPPGFEGTVKAMKKHPEIDNPYALAWYMKNKGAKSHRKADGSVKEEEMKSYKQFVESLVVETKCEEEIDENAFDWKNNHKTTSSGKFDVKQVGNRTIVTRKYDPETGHSTGTDEPEEKEKRGRGRPAGSKSGAKQKGSGKSNDYRGVPQHSLNLPNTNK